MISIDLDHRGLVPTGTGGGSATSVLTDCDRIEAFFGGGGGGAFFFCAASPNEFDDGVGASLVVFPVVSCGEDGVDERAAIRAKRA